MENSIVKLIHYERLNSVFGINKEIAENIKEFTGGNDTFRIFTMFNSLGETRQSVMNDFFDKRSRLEYKLKLYALLDLIFNKNINEIISLGNKLEKLTKEIKDLEKLEFKYEYINSTILSLILYVTFNLLSCHKLLLCRYILNSFETSSSSFSHFPPVVVMPAFPT